MNIIEYLQIFSGREEEEEEATLHCILAEWRRVVTQCKKESKDQFYLLHVNQRGRKKATHVIQKEKGS